MMSDMAERIDWDIEVEDTVEEYRGYGYQEGGSGTQTWERGQDRQKADRNRAQEARTLRAEAMAGPEPFAPAGSAAADPLPEEWRVMHRIGRCWLCGLQVEPGEPCGRCEAERVARAAYSKRDRRQRLLCALSMVAVSALTLLVCALILALDGRMDAIPGGLGR